VVYDVSSKSRRVRLSGSSGREVESIGKRKKEKSSSVVEFGEIGF